MTNTRLREVAAGLLGPRLTTSGMDIDLKASQSEYWPEGGMVQRDFNPIHEPTRTSASQTCIALGLPR
jgi:hypothetical protein